MISKNLQIIFSEMSSVLSKVDEYQVEQLITLIKNSNKIVCIGAGRVGMATRAFSMRLAHLGFKSYFLGDSNLPSINKRDLLFTASGSGETQTIYDLVMIANKVGAKIALITGNPESRMGKLADQILLLKAPSKAKPLPNFKSRQPMTTLNEQCLWVLYDALVLELMKHFKRGNSYMSKRHSILE